MSMVSGAPIVEEQPTLVAEVNVQKFVLMVLAFMAVSIVAMAGAYYYWQHADPYVQAVEAIHGDAVRGNAIFQMNCAGCHGRLATGKVGPSLLKVSSRRSQPSLIDQVTSGNTPPMPKFQASPSEMADLLSYLKTL
jgi:mono/diheme cytochrome c family protein